jgi:hypothetical protein
MKRRNWKLWVAGIALAQVLVLGADLSLWPLLGEAEQAASRVNVGMAGAHWRGLVGGRLLASAPVKRGELHSYRFGDGSTLWVVTDYAGALEVTKVWPPTPVPPTTCLRRRLACVLPFLGE